MTKSWADKFKKNELDIFSLAPDWYLEAKKHGASKEKLFALVEEYCQKTLQEAGEEMPEGLVELTIATYEA